MQYERKIEDIMNTDNTDTIKISTLVYFVLGLVIPFWIVSIPICWFLAYKTFKSNEGTPLFKNGKINYEFYPNKPNSKYEDLEKLKELFDNGAITKEEFEKEKEKILNS